MNGQRIEGGSCIDEHPASTLCFTPQKKSIKRALGRDFVSLKSSQSAMENTVFVEK